jgi:site-specific DNA-methyltransferase (adenine-specific)|uniref:Adenine-specific methyltransferase n=1 Tax=Siphoviridae sp. ctsUY14 TaxID=2825693 RepID=A0A8S5P5Z7_9CAUD|nr:MAG TPA: adenine-specific methyltransferase [Siphoviridae sp. ctsUY14]
MIDLRQGDCLELMKDIPDKTIDLIVTDPPYNVSATNDGGTINKVKKLNKSLKDLVETNITNGYDIETLGEEFMRVMKEPNIYLWCNKTQIPEYFKFYVEKYKCKFDILCWHKNNALPTYSNKYLSDTEYLLYFRKGKGKCFPKSYEDAKTYYIAPINHKDKKKYKHPTIKPLDITEKVIKNSSKENDIILDPFMGSGTTGVACKQLNRNFIGIELLEEYFNIAKERINSIVRED